MTDAAIAELAGLVGTRAACRAVGRPQATHYRRPPPEPAAPTATQGRAQAATPGAVGP